MKSRLLLFLFVALASVFFCVNVLGQAGRRAAPPPKTADKCMIREPIHGALATEVANFRLFSMPFTVTGRSGQERNTVYKLAEASPCPCASYCRHPHPN